jgi:uncharacterized coiled-coil DUF342 family protein
MHMSSAKKIENGANQDDQVRTELIQQICMSVATISVTRGVAAGVAAAEAKLNWNIQEEYYTETEIEAIKTMMECPKDVKSSVIVCFNAKGGKLSYDKATMEIDYWRQQAHTYANEIATASASLSKVKDEFHRNFTVSSQRLTATLEKIMSWVKAHPEVGEIADIWSEVNSQWNHIAAELTNFDQHILEFTKKFDDVRKDAVIAREQIIPIIIKQSLPKRPAQDTPSTLHIQ